VVEHQQQLHPAADGEAIHRGDPRFHDHGGPPASAVLDKDSSHELMDIAQFTAQQEINQ
jgi:hypothetical protein